VCMAEEIFTPRSFQHIPSTPFFMLLNLALQALTGYNGLPQRPTSGPGCPAGRGPTPRHLGIPAFHLSCQPAGQLTMTHTDRITVCRSLGGLLTQDVGSRPRSQPHLFSGSLPSPAEKTHIHVPVLPPLPNPEGAMSLGT
jgi:hypothetical protein